MNKPLWDEDQHSEKSINLSFLGSRGFMSVIAVLSGILGVGILYYLLQPTKTPQVTPQIIEPQVEALKIVPAEPGGLKVPHQDKKIYESISAADGELHENPVVIENVVKAPVETVVAPEIIEAELEANALEKDVMIEEIAPATETVVIEEKIKVAPKPVQKKALKKKPVVKKAAPKKGHRVQIAALQSKGLAEKEWGILKRKYRTLLAKQPFHILKVNLGKKGTFYRLHAGNFPTKKGAQSFCKKLKAAGGACIPPR